MKKIKKNLKKMKKIKFTKNFDAHLILKNKNLVFFNVFSKKFSTKQIFLSYFLRENNKVLN